jgi:hypothetical protein
MPIPLRASRPILTAAQGPRVEQRAILARTFQKSQGNRNSVVDNNRAPSPIT